MLVQLMLILCVHWTVASERADTIVVRWFRRQPLQWLNALERCDQLALLFADERWIGAAQQLAAEVERYGHCVAYYLWLAPRSNSSALCAPATLCYVDDNHGTSQRWGTQLYFERIDQRVPLMGALLRHLVVDEHKGVALIDADVVLQRNVLARFARSNATLVIQQEWPCPTAPAQLCANGGLYWLRRTHRARSLIGRVEQLMARLRLPDQDAFDVALARGHFGAVHYLDRQRYANGYTLQHNASFDARLAHAIHVNWLPTTDQKLAWLARLRAPTPIV